MAVILHRGMVVAAADDQLPVIGWRNLLVDSSATVTGSPASNAANAYDWLTSDAWTTNASGGTLTLALTSPGAADYFAFCAHTLHEENGLIKLQYDNGSGFTDVAETEIRPGDGRPRMFLFDRIEAASWRVVITSDAAVDLGMVAFGLRLTLERGCRAGFAPPSLVRAGKVLNAVTEGGQFTGRSVVRNGSRGQIALADLTEGWVREHFEPFMTHSRLKPWFWLWDPKSHPDEAAYCWQVGDIQCTYEGPRFMGASIPYAGIAE